MKRLGIFLMCDSNGEVNDYVIYLLKDIVKNLEDLFIVSNGKLLDNEQKKLFEFTNNVIQRDNIGFDFGGWQDAILNKIGFEKIRQYDELVLFNDSFFGPLYPFSEVFDSIEEEIDFWGLSVHGETQNVFGNCPYGYRPQYLQTYFLAIRNNMLKSEEFKKFWENLPVITKFEEVGEKISCVFTKYFSDLGYKWCAYSDTSDLDSTRERAMSYHTFNLYDMVVRRKFPIIKRKTFITDKDKNLRYNYGGEISRTMSYITKNSNYPVTLIYKYLLKKYNIYDLSNSFNWNVILPAECSDEYKTKSSVCVIAHLFYEDLLEYDFDYLCRVPEEYDIIVTTDSESKKKAIFSYVKKYKMSNIQVIIVNSRGRDLAAFLVGCKNIINNYEYICFVHDKKSLQKEFPTVGSQFCDVLWESMLKSKSYIYNIIKRFDTNTNLGMLVPMNVYHGTYFHSAMDYWTICYDKSIELAEKLNLKVNIDKNKPPISVGTVFWCRSDALRKLLDTEFDYMDFPSEPLPNDGSISHCLERLITYVVQDAGYYTEKVYPSDLAAVEIQNLRFMWNETLLNLKDISSINYATHQHLIKSIQKLKNGIENKEEVEREKEVVLVEIGLKRALKNYLKKIFVKDKDNGRI